MPVEVLKGFAAGFVATAPMTVAMEAMHRQLPERERQPLPPRQITMNAARKARVAHHLDDEKDRFGATLAAHFAFGSAMGGAYALAAPHLPGPPVVRGVGFAMLVYAANYLGLMPAAGLTPHAPKDTPRRIGLMLAAHVVWGATIGLLLKPDFKPARP
jgi:hypothetical protein